MLAIRLLGHFEIDHNGEPLLLNSRPAQSLLAFLLLHPHTAHRRERLAGLLWPESEDAQSRDNLRHALWKLRRAIPDGYLAVDRIAIGWDGDAPWQLDCTLLEETGDGASTAALLTAVSLYAGELLPGFYDEWVALERERLAAVYAERMTRLLERLLAEGQWRAAIEWAERWIAQSRTPEPAYRVLMTAHASLGDTASALAAYQRCVETLEREVDVTPSPETEDLADSIRHSQFTIPHSQFTIPHLQFPIPHSPISNLPTPTTPLIGRATELATLAALLADPSHRLITILGPGGMGKSRLALAAGHAAQEAFPDGVFLVELVALTSANDIPRAIGDSLGYPFQKDDRPPRRQILDYLRGRRALLILDNCEHLLDAVDFFVELLKTAPGLRLLATSRERMRLRAETVYRLDGLAYPPDRRIPQPKEGFGAIELFVSSARRLRPGFAPGEDDLRAISRIAQTVNGMPLALLLAASWSDLLSVGEIAQEVSGSVELLQADLRDLDPRHRSVSVLFDQSWQRLSGEEQTALMALALCAGGFDRAGARAVAGATLPLLTRLVDKALLWAVGEDRYDLHELVRQLARQKLSPAQREQARQAHAAHYLALAGAEGSQLHGPRYAQLLAKLGREEGNIRAAWGWAVEEKESALLGLALPGVAGFYHQPGRWQDGAALLAAAQIALADSPEAHVQKLCAYLTGWEGVLLRSGGQVQEGEEKLRRSIEALSALQAAGEDTRFERAFALRQSGLEFVGLDQQRQMDECTESLRLCREIGDRAGAAEALLILGHMHGMSADNRAALGFLEEALTIYRQLQDPLGLFETLDSLSFVHNYLADIDETLAYSQEAEQTLQRYGIPLATQDSRLPVALMSAGRLDEAAALAQASVARFQELGVRANALTWIQNILARIYVHSGAYAAAQEEAAQADALFVELRGWRHPFFMRTIGVAALALGAHDKAEEMLALPNWEVTGSVSAYPFVDLAYLALAREDLAQARSYLHDAFARVQERADYFLALRALPACALLFARQEELEQAAELYTFARTFPYVANSRWFYDVAGKELDAVTAALPADVRAAAEARGRARQLPELTDKVLALL